MLRRVVRCAFAVLATVAGWELLVSAGEHSAADAEVVVKALRFSGDPPAYSFRVVNNGTKPITAFSLGTDDSWVLEATFDTVPTSIGSPRGWKGRHMFAYERPWLKYRWEPVDRGEVWIAPGQALSGFSVQLPRPRGDHRDEAGRPAPVDLADIPFTVMLDAGRFVRGVVQLD